MNELAAVSIPVLNDNPLAVQALLAAALGVRKSVSESKQYLPRSHENVTIEKRGQARRE